MNCKIFRIFFVLSLCLIPISTTASPTITAIAEQALPAVVFIVTETNPFDRSYFRESLRFLYEYLWPPAFCHGSGFVIHEDGHVITNMHVVKDVTKVLVLLQFDDVRVYNASVVGTDSRTDIAVLKIENQDDRKFPYLKFGNSNHAQVGEQVIVMGTPYSSRLESTLTTGVISATDRNHCGMNEIEGYIQTDAAINGGNSGGPVLNLSGEVIGVVDWYLSHFLGYEGLGFAIPSHVAQHIADQMISQGRVSQGFLGIELEEDRGLALDCYYFDYNKGAIIKTVIKDAPAQKAGLNSGDLILQINDVPIRSPSSLRNQVCILAPDTEIHLTVDRKGTIAQISVSLGSDELSKKHSQLKGRCLVI